MFALIVSFFGADVGKYSRSIEDWGFLKSSQNMRWFKQQNLG